MAVKVTSHVRGGAAWGVAGAGDWSVSVQHGNAPTLCRSRQLAGLRFRAPAGATGQRLREGAAFAAGRYRGLERVRQSRTCSS